MADRFDWSKLSGAIVSRTSDALNEAKQIKDSISQQDKPEIDWSKWSSAITSRASHALKEAKQLKDSISQQDKPEIYWSKWSGAVTSRASHALKEAKQLKDSMSQQDLPKSDWSKMSGAITSRASDALNEVKQLDYVSISHEWSFAIANELRRFIKIIQNIPWCKLWSYIFFKLWTFVLYVLVAINNWSIRHPYVTAGVLLFISALANPVIFISLLKMTRGATLTVIFLPVQLLVWLYGFRSRGVVAGSLASAHQSRSYGGLVPRTSSFAILQSYGATTPPVTLRTLISLLMNAVAAYVLGRHWGWWN